MSTPESAAPLEASSIVCWLTLGGVCSAGVSGNYTLPRWVAMGNDPGSRQLPAWPSMPAIVGMAEAVLGPYSGAAA